MRDLEGSVSTGNGAADGDQMSCPTKALITYFEGPLIMRDIMRDIQTRRTNYSMRPRDGFFVIIMRDAGKTIPLQLSLLTTI